MNWFRILSVALGALIVSLAVSCSSGSNPTPTPATSPTAGDTRSPTTAATATNANAWLGTVDPTAIPLGDGNVSTSPEVGFVDSCTTNFRGGGAEHAGAWIDATGGTWDSQQKLVVEGDVSWPDASYTISENVDDRVLTTNDEPVGYPTGVYPIASSDPAHEYDPNPNHIAAQDFTFDVPLNPAPAAAPGCLGLGPIGVMSDGVLLYDALDDAGRDAGAHEAQDSCDGHPDGQDRYHYHTLSPCLASQATGSSTLVGYALDGYGIYVERDANGDLPSDADLDACHGRTSEVMWNGTETTIYHYDATLEYPYTIGCFHGTATAGVR